MNKQLAKKLNQQFELSQNEHVFLTSEFAEEAEISHQAARNRLIKLENQGLVKRARIRKPTGIYAAWEYIENANKR